MLGRCEQVDREADHSPNKVDKVVVRAVPRVALVVVDDILPAAQLYEGEANEGADQGARLRPAREGVPGLELSVLLSAELFCVVFPILNKLLRVIREFITIKN